MIAKLFAAVALFGVIDDEPTLKERVIVEKAFHCKNARGADPYELWRLLEAEEQAGLPARLAGITLAAACTESGYTDARGDCKPGKGCRARGFFQLWPWWSKRYGIDRADAMQSGRAWLEHMIRQIPKTRKACPRLSGLSLWRAAQVRAVRAPRGPRCGQTSLHWRRWRRWFAKARNI